MDYIEFDIIVQPREPWAEILSVELAELGFESFVQEQEHLFAYLPAESESKEVIALLESFGAQDEMTLSYQRRVIPAQNWNASWESSFEPVIVGDFCAIRAPFHVSQTEAVQHEIIIEPKMSFGTGHHPTTFLMVKTLSQLDLQGKSVLDMGCGTGVLAILAKKCGASDVLGIDIEDWAVENAKENAASNGVAVEILLGSVAQIPDQHFEVVLANINRNILVEQLPVYSKVIQAKGQLLLSGFMEQDVDYLRAVYMDLGFKEIEIQKIDHWVCIRLEKQ